MTSKELDRLWASPGNWSFVYRCAADPRVIVPRRRRWMGWTLNFAHPLAWPALLLCVVIAVAPVLVLLYLGLGTLPRVLVVELASIAAIVGFSHWEAARSLE